MKQPKRSVSVIFLLAVLLCTVIFLSGCTSADQLVIDGEVALQMANMINDQLWDTEGARRGNTASNMRNGGYILIDGENLWFIVSMEFEDGSVEYYLQHLLTNQIGSVTAQNEIVASVRGTLVGIYAAQLIYIDEDHENQLFSLDLETYAQEPLFNLPVTNAFLLDDTIYVGTQGQGDLYELRLTKESEQSLKAQPTLLYTGGGILAGVADGVAYLLGSTEGSSIIRRVDVTKKLVAGRIVGGPYRDIQIAGSWLFYKDGDKLMRQPLSGGTAFLALHQSIAEYAVRGHWLAAIGTNGGIYVSHLDGTGMSKIVVDQAYGLQLTDSMLFYRNKNDGNAIYVIDLAEGKRTALLGITQTDGGSKFEEIGQDAVPAFEQRFGEFISTVADKWSYSEQYIGAITPPIIFAEIAEDGSITYYRHIDDEVSADQVEALVVISTDKTILGRYTDGGLAYRLDRKLTLFSLGNETPQLTLVVEGRPPTEIKSGPGDREGIPLPWHQKALNLRQAVLAFAN